MSSSATEIPLVSVKPLMLHQVANPTFDEDLALVGKDLLAAFSKMGFVYIVDHGVSSQLIEDSLNLSKEFFDLPLKNKRQYLRGMDLHQGYVEAGQEIFNPLDTFHEIRECYEVTRISGEGARFPDESVPGFRDSLVQLINDSSELTKRILMALSLSLGLSKDFFTNTVKEMFQSGNQSSKMRSIHYPPIEGPIRAGVVRCGQHTDYGLITLLFQDSMGGLEVWCTDTDAWVMATPVPGAILVNAGDLMEIYTKGLIQATLHRVVVPKEEVKKRLSRQSIVIFVHPYDDTLVQPLDCITRKALKEYEPITAIGHLKKRFSETLKY